MLTEPYVVPATPLTDTEGAAYSLADDTDKRLTLVFFGYTNCPDICQVVMQTLASAMTRLDDADREQVDVVFVTTDPARDDETVLRDYLDHFDPGFVGLTGPLATIVDDRQRPRHRRRARREAAERRLRRRRHGTSVLGIDSDDEVPIVWTQGTSATQFASDVHQLLDG